MGTSENKISRAPEALSRPSLLSTGAPGADHNILDAMPGRSARAEAAPRPQRQWWWWLLPLLAATAWGISTQLTRPPAVRPAPTASAVPLASPAAASAMPQAASVAKAPASPSAPPADPTATAPAPSASTDPFQSLAAATAQKPATPAHSPQTHPVTGLQTRVDAPPALPAQPTPRVEPTSKSTVAEKKSADPKTRAETSPAAPSPNKAATTAARKASAPSKAEAQASATTPKQAKPTANAHAGSRDPDVELLNAIMKHLGNGQAAASATGPTRSPQTIAELVKSCRTKDAIEALMCQRRICEGSWGKAQACPMEQAPKAARAASPA